MAVSNAIWVAVDPGRASRGVGDGRDCSEKRRWCGGAADRRGASDAGVPAATVRVVLSTAD